MFRTPKFASASLCDKALDKIVRRPLLLKKYEHPNLPAEPDVRKMQVKRFNEYGLIYTLVNDTFWIVSVAHAKRNPSYWIYRLTTRSWLHVERRPARIQ